jgi:chloramphenicol-sensitive protein RarD
MNKPTASEAANLKAGYIFATLAYLGWGFFPIYWKLLKQVPSIEILCHRVIWSFVFYTLVVFFKDKHWRIFWPSSKKTLFYLSLAAAILMGNWFVYIYAVNSNQIVESSLGYFINPLINITLGVVLLKERLSKLQLVATICAAVGVLIISMDQGHLPWIALFLAISFSTFGLIKKLNPVPGLHSSQFESFVMLPVAFGLLALEHKWMGHFPFPWEHGFDLATGLLLAGGGLITGLPLIFFSEAAQRMPFYLLGFFQFLAPSFQFLSGVVLFSEPLSSTKLKGFIFIWVAGMLILLNNWLMNRFRRN